MNLQKIIKAQEELILNLKEVGMLYFSCKDKASKADVEHMRKLHDKGRELESELSSLKAQEESTKRKPEIKSPVGENLFIGFDKHKRRTKQEMADTIETVKKSLDKAQDESKSAVIKIV